MEENKRMKRHLHREIEKIKKNLLVESARVEEMLQNAMKSLRERDHRLADRVAASDLELDRIEIEIEEECLKVLALNQPVAIDLRYIIATIKMNNDLERIGDLAVNIAESARYLALKPPIEIPDEIPLMARKARHMVKRSLDALVESDVAIANEVCEADTEVDTLLSDLYPLIGAQINKSPAEAELWLRVVIIGRSIERIADHATNIAEDVIYMVDGEISRHRRF